MQRCVYLSKALFENILLMIDNGGQRPHPITQLGYTREQAEAIHRLKHSKDDYQRLGLPYAASRSMTICMYHRCNTRYVKIEKKTVKICSCWE